MDAGVGVLGRGKGVEGGFQREHGEIKNTFCPYFTGSVEVTSTVLSSRFSFFVCGVCVGGCVWGVYF